MDTGWICTCAFVFRCMQENVLQNIISGQTTPYCTRFYVLLHCYNHIMYAKIKNTLQNSHHHVDQECKEDSEGQADTKKIDPGTPTFRNVARPAK